MQRLLATSIALLLFNPAADAKTPLTIFGNATPKVPVDQDPNAVSLGVKFFSNVSGTISGIRFYRGHNNTNGYTVKLFSNGGSLLASARITKDSCAVPCWEQALFAAPISISLNTTYVAAYYTSNGRYAGDNNALTNGFANAPLFAQGTGGNLGGNGVYTYSTGFPNQTYQNSNYWVDVLFTPGAPTLLMSFSPANPSVPADTPAGTVVATVNVSWSDGSPFTGTVGFAQPYTDDAGTFALSGNSILINPGGPGISHDSGTIQNVSIIATQ